MSAAEEQFARDCAASLARVRVVAEATRWDDPAVAEDLDELSKKRLARGDSLQAGRDAFDREQDRRLRDGEEPF